MPSPLGLKVHQARCQLRSLGVCLLRHCPRFYSVPRLGRHARYSISSSFYSQPRPVIEIRRNASLPLVFHEFGHYLVYAYALDRKKLFRRHFGKECYYYLSRVTAFWLLDSAARVFRIRPLPGQPSYYALVDGEEAFCECVARLSKRDFDVDEAADGDSELEEKLNAVMRLLSTCRRVVRK